MSPWWIPPSKTTKLFFVIFVVIWVLFFIPGVYPFAWKNFKPVLFGWLPAWFLWHSVIWVVAMVMFILWVKLTWKEPYPEPKE